MKEWTKRELEQALKWRDKIAYEWTNRMLLFGYVDTGELLKKYPFPLGRKTDEKEQN